MNHLEYEATILNTAWGMIDGMVNHNIFVKQELCGKSNLIFKSDIHARLFVILLTDFLSSVKFAQSNIKTPNGDSRPILDHLKKVCQRPKLGSDLSDLNKTVSEFQSWLGAKITSNGVNLSSIDVYPNIEVERYRYIKMCGNFAKHNPARLDRDIRSFRKLLKNSGHCVGWDEAYFGLEQFFERFFNDMFWFHSNHIAEFLNNIRWYMFLYLRDEYIRSVRRTYNYEGFDTYDIPEAINDSVARTMYWDLMNRVSIRPYIPHFVVHEAFKKPHPSESIATR